jgi:LuxR family maltose regulon positive regulatory protein
MTGLAATEQGEHPVAASANDSHTQGLLRRADLVAKLNTALSRKVTIIAAPPGSGKTSLLRTWSESASEDVSVAFVSVQRDQRDAQQFWLAVREAIHQSTGKTPERQTPAPALDGEAEVARIVSELAEQSGPLVLIIDDLHELHSDDALLGLERLLADMPSSTQAVLSTRRDPRLRLNRLRLAGEIAELRADDLRFSEMETRDLLAGSGISLSDAGAGALHQRAEGWAAGIRLAALSLRGHDDPERFVTEFSGTDRAIGEYLMAEMLGGQPREVQSMLFSTSIAERLNGELADLLASRSGSEQMLLELEDANAFVMSLDPGRTWFRYHHLLADFLRLELRRTSASEIPDLHRRASRWFADHGHAVEAIRHALAARDWPGAARLVADHSFGWVLDGEAGTISAVLQAFPEGASADNPDLALAHAANELNQGRLEQAAAQLALAESHVQDVPPARRRRLTVAIASLRLGLARRSGQFTEVIEQVNLLDASIADESNELNGMDDELRGVALLNLGIVETWSRRFDDAERHLSEGAALAQTIGRPYLEVACRAHQVFPTRVVSLATARERGRQAVAVAEGYGLGDRSILAPALGLLAFWAIWTGEFDEGEGWLRRAWEVAEPRIDPAAAVIQHLAEGMLHAGRGQQEPALEEFAAAAQAQSRLSGADALATPSSVWLAATQARLGMPDEARATLAGLSAEPDPLGFTHNARAAICIAEDNPAGALDVLRDTPDIIPPTGPAFMLVETHLLIGLAHLGLGDRRAAAAAVEAALAAAEPDRLIFPFAMTEAAELLDTLSSHETAHGALLTTIVDLLQGRSAPSADGRRVPDVEELSPSELRVLGLLPTNLTRPEIASELYVSVNTVNTHIRNIYAKLGAHDRSSAVQHARELRLLSRGLSRTPR